MASVKYGALITDIKGKIGGTVFQGSASGAVAKSGDWFDKSKALTKADAGRIIPTQLNTATVAGIWRSLTAVQKASWVTGAVNYPAYNRFGEAYTPSGYQVFMALNFQVYQLTGAVLYECPVPVTINPMPAFAIAQPDLTHLNLSWTGSIQTDCNIRVEATQPMAFGNQPKNSFFKAIQELPDSTTSPQNLFAAYSVVYGSFPINAAIYFRFTSISTTTGQKGIPVVIKLVTA